MMFCLLKDDDLICLLENVNYITGSAGMSRSVSLALAYLIGVENMALIDAFRLVKSKRSIVAPNP